ncbi:hypothetical protein [Lysobacter sp. H23M47]|uniref:hypothetical protein n=1 Tax=Lysobacter sp. H23M47 TaxID=2781024 RepID=UPI001D16F7DC|nr:hypothetical protein [Lysobacter sp. H23M47]
MPARKVTPSPASSYVVPPAGTKTLIKQIGARRDETGGIVIEGVALLPPGTKIGIDRYSQTGRIEAQAKATVGPDGGFTSEPFSNLGQPIAAGSNRIGISSYFNRAWQSEAVIAVVGDGGKNLPSEALSPDDSEFPDASRHLQEERQVDFPPAPEDVVAISKVKGAKLLVQGQGKSAEPIGEVVQIFSKSPGFTPLRWSAAKSGSKWIVTLDAQEPAGRRQAQWEYDPASGKVRYLDPLAKILSWVPAD